MTEPTTFTYTAEEIAHLHYCSDRIWQRSFDPSENDPAYFRHLASLLDERDERGSQHYGYPSAADCEPVDTAADMLELADAAECGMVGGEELV